jgi:hypothetical protein
VRPQAAWRPLHDDLGWTIDWCEFFGGEMRGFHVVFELRITASGTLVFWADDGCVIRRNGQVVHCDRGAHMLERSTIEASAGDRLEVAQWQATGEWLWGAWLEESEHSLSPEPAGLLEPYLAAVQRRLSHPSGPPLKMYTHGETPVASVVALYSMILNGYAPSKVLVLGEHQWSPATRAFFDETLPFAEFVPSGHLLDEFQRVGGTSLAEMARKYWYVMKSFVALLSPPEACCLMDDDVFVLDDVGDALHAFAQCDLVFMPDIDHSEGYVGAWRGIHGQTGRLRTARFNAGLFWIRQVHDPYRVAAYALGSPAVDDTYSVYWEQGLIAGLYAYKPIYQLPSQRYFYPVFDGLPGGMLGYDYITNPCSFASIHFGGPFEKPSNAEALQLMPHILGRRSERIRLSQ